MQYPKYTQRIPFGKKDCEWRSWIPNQSRKVCYSSMHPLCIHCNRNATIKGGCHRATLAIVFAERRPGSLVPSSTDPLPDTDTGSLFYETDMIYSYRFHYCNCNIYISIGAWQLFPEEGRFAAFRYLGAVVISFATSIFSCRAVGSHCCTKAILIKHSW